MFKKLAGLTAVAGLFLAGTASAQSNITGTAHDLSAQGYTGGRICIVCHTTHNTDTTVSNAPLWNHALSTATYQPYPSGGSMQSTPGQPSGISLLCLSCHDGTIGVDSFGGSTGPGTATIGAGGLVSTDLRNDHPIALTFDAALATSDGELHNPTTQNSGLGSTIDQDMLYGASNDQLECASCHDVHDDTFTPFLVKGNANSALCLTCHNK